MKKIGILGGSFDPVHFGHLNLAVQMMEIHNLDRVLFCPAALSPFKEKEPPKASPRQRLEMIQRAISPFSAFALLDVEMHRPSPSYSIDTVKMLIEDAEAAGEERKFYWLLGEDGIAGFSSWKDVELLVQLAPPLIGSRQGSYAPGYLPPPVAETVSKGITKMAMMDISSTFVRHRLACRLHCEHLIPEKVLDYIHENKIY